MTTSAVLRISVSKAKDVNWNGNMVATGIFKKQVEGKLKVRRLNIDGDEQADLTVHGGPDKAVYAYPIEQYEHWQKVLPDRDWQWGSFGENLTVSGFDENSLRIGDKLKIGSARFVVTQPRMPCFKLGIRLADPTMVRRFFESGKWGFYLAVSQEGEIETGDTIEMEGGDGNDITLDNVSRCIRGIEEDEEMILRVLQSNLAKQMKEQLQYQLERKRR